MGDTIEICLSGKSYEILEVVLGYFLDTLIPYIIPKERAGGATSICSYIKDR